MDNLYTIACEKASHPEERLQYWYLNCCNIGENKQSMLIGFKSQMRSYISGMNTSMIGLKMAL